VATTRNLGKPPVHAGQPWSPAVPTRGRVIAWGYWHDRFRLHLLCPAAVAAPVHLASAGLNGRLHGAHRVGRTRHFPARSAKVREWESARNAGVIHSPAPVGAGEYEEKLQILLKPAQQAILVITYMLAFVQPMPFTRVHHHFGGNVLLTERTIKRVGLVDRHAIVSLSVYNQRRCLNPVDIGDRRPLAIYLRLLRRAYHSVAQVAHIPVRDIGLSMKAMEVADACSHYRRFEARGLRHRPRRHKAAVAPAHDAGTVTIHQALSNQVIDPIENILEIFATHITQHGIRKGRAAP